MLSNLTHLTQKTSKNKINGTIWISSQSYPPEEENILRKTSNKIAATTMWTKLGLTITKAASSAMKNPRFFLHHFLGCALGCPKTHQSRLIKLHMQMLVLFDLKLLPVFFKES